MRNPFAMFCLLIVFGLPNLAVADEAGGSIEIRLTAREVDPSETSLLLLPSETELVEGNAAVVMLRLIGGENLFMRDLAPKIRDLLMLQPDDPRIEKEFAFDRIYHELSRAALMRNAAWEYPLDRGRELLLPDLQSHRYIAGFGLSLWIRNAVASQNASLAIDGVRTQLACARHVSRTPVLVNQMVGVDIALMSVERLESMVGNAWAPNLYWPLAMLPDSLADLQTALQWESASLQRSLPSLGDSMPPIGDPVWSQIVSEFSDLMVSSGAFVNTEMEAMVLRMTLLVAAKKELPAMQLYSEKELSQMPEIEWVMRWILHVSNRVNYQIQAASSLDPIQAIPALVEIQTRNEKMKNDLGAPGVPFVESPAEIYLSTARFDRFIKLLQAVEAIRHQLAINGGEFPESLDAITGLAIPRDPLTGKAFLYQQRKHVAKIQTPPIDGITESMQRMISKAYEIRIGE